MECGDVSSSWIRPVCHPGATEQVHRIPDAVMGNDSIQQCWEDHRDSARNSALDPGQYRIRLDRKMCAMLFADYDVFYMRTCRNNGDFVLFDGNFFMSFMRQYLAEPPDASGNCQYSTKNAYKAAGDYAGEVQHDTEGQHDGPRGRRRQMNCPAVQA